MDAIIFGGSIDAMCKEVQNAMQKEFEMLMLGELSFFLDLHISQLEKG